MNQLAESLEQRSYKNSINKTELTDMRLGGRVKVNIAGE